MGHLWKDMSYLGLGVNPWAPVATLVGMDVSPWAPVGIPVVGMGMSS